MPDRANFQIAFVNSKCCFGLCQLNVGSPQFFIAPVGHIATQQITACTQRGPVPFRFIFLPFDSGGSLFCFGDGDLEQFRGTGVLLQQSTKFPFHLLGIAFLFLATGCHRDQTVFNLLFKATDNRIILFKTFSTSTQNKNFFCPFRVFTDLHFQPITNLIPVLVEQVCFKLFRTDPNT